MDEPVKALDEYLAILKRRKWQLILPTTLLFLLTVPVALIIPAWYRSTATILIEQQEIPADLVRTTVSSFADQRIQVISQRVMTTRNLSDIIERYNLYPDLRRRFSINAVVTEMRKAIDRKMISADVLDPRSGRVQQATIAFSLSYESESANLAQKVTNDLVSLFLNENIEQRQAAVEEATAFLGGEANKLRERIGALETQLATFKEQHGANLPEFAALNRELMARTEERLRDNTQAMRTLNEQSIYLESELAKLGPLSVGGVGASAQSPEAHLQELEMRYVGIAARYSPIHPDRVQIEREIAALRGQVGQSDAQVIQNRLDDLRGQLGVLRKSYSDTHPDVLALKRGIAATVTELAKARRSNKGRNSERPAQNTENPAYVQLRIKLDGTRAEIESLKQTRATLEHDVAQFEARITEGPKIEQEYKSLLRDYDNATSKYKEVREKEMQAQLAKSLESDRKGERFSLVEPPEVPDLPYKPNRPAVLLLGLVLSVMVGAGNLAVREILDKGLRGVRVILAITGNQPLAIIPYIVTKADRRRRVRRVWLLTLGGLITLALSITAVHFLLMPLDILWFKLLDRITDLIPMGNPSAR